MDKDQITGIVLMLLLMFGYFFFFSPDQQEPTTPTSKETVTSITPNTVTQQEAIATIPDTVLSSKYGVFGTLMQGESKSITLENSDAVFTFNTKGGSIEKVILKNYVTNEKKTLVLFDNAAHKISENIETNSGTIDLNQLYYQAEKKGNTLVFKAQLDDNAYIERSYTLPEQGFVLSYNVNTPNTSAIIKSQAIAFKWTAQIRNLEKDLEQSRIRTTVNYYMPKDDKFDYLNETSKDKEEVVLEQAAAWVSFKQKFFNTSIITDKSFEKVKVSLSPNDAPEMVKNTEMELQIPLADLNGAAKLRYYFGPNVYDICEQVAPRFEKNVYLGWSFLAYINLYLVVPVFKLLEKVSDNYGLVIFLLVLVVKILLFPLTYKSYKSMAKMRVLKPEMDELKAKYGDDIMKIQQETMAIYKQVGVNPLSGCIPILAQMPVFIALFNFFPNAIELRQESFLWATDLSSYDSVLDLPFSIPFYGDHVSLFTILMTISTIIYTYINNQMSNTAVQQPQKVIISYVSPIIFMFFLNNFASGLTYYYFISNIITIAQQLGIRQMIDDSKIRKILDNNKKKHAAGGGSAKKGVFSNMLDEAMKKSQSQIRDKKK